MKFHNLYQIVANNDECVILRLKEGCEHDLWLIPFFDGNEKDIKVLKGEGTTVTVKTLDDKVYSWSWGGRSYTLTSENVAKKGHLIKQALEIDFGIYMGNDANKRRKTNHINDYGQAEDCKIKVMYWGRSKSDQAIIHRNGDFIIALDSVEKAIDWLELRYNLTNMARSVAETGVNVITYDASLIYSENNLTQPMSQIDR